MEKGKPDYGTFLLARSYSPVPSTAAKPFVPISFNLGKDIKVAHLRPILEILKKDVEVMLLEPTAEALFEFPLNTVEISREEVQEGALDEDYRSMLLSMKHPMVVYSRIPGRNSVITRSYYKFCDTKAEGSIPIYIRIGSNKTRFAVGYETEYNDEHTEVSQCDFASHVDLLKKVYNIKMNSPNTTTQTMTLGVFNVEISKKPTIAALTLYLMDKDNPEIFWDILKEYFKNLDRFKTLARVSLKRFKEGGSYCLVLLVSEEPDEETLRSLRSLIRSFVGPVSAFFARSNKACGISMYSAMRLSYSNTTLTVTGPNRKTKVNAVIANKAEFLDMIGSQNDGIAFKLGRSFLNENIVDEFTARVTTPMHGRKAIFEKIVCLLFYERTEWSDNIASIDIRSDNGSLKLTVVFRLLKEKERYEAQEFVINSVGELYQELTGNEVRCGASEVISLPPKKHVLVKAEAKKEPLVAVDSKSEQAFSEKQTSKTTRSKNKGKSATSQNDTLPTEVTLYETPKKPAKRPKKITKFENWLFDLTDEEFEHELEEFSKRLNVVNFKPETNYWKVFAFMDEVPLNEIMTQHDMFLDFHGNFCQVVQQAFQNIQEAKCATNILLMFVNRNYIKADTIKATVSAMSCHFARSIETHLIVTNLINRYMEILMTWDDFFLITRLTFEVKVAASHVTVRTIIEIPDEHAARIDDISAQIRDTIKYVNP